MTWYKKAIAEDKKYHKAYNNLGIIYGGGGYHKQALEWYKKAVEANPDFADGYSNMGATYVKLGQVATAVKVLE